MYLVPVGSTQPQGIKWVPLKSSESLDGIPWPLVLKWPTVSQYIVYIETVIVNDKIKSSKESKPE